MNNDIIKAINNASLRLDQIGQADLPEISAAERKVIDFEIRAAALHAKVVGLSAKLRDENRVERHGILGNLNTLRRDSGIQNAAEAHRMQGGTAAQQAYFTERVECMLLDLARNLAWKKALEAEHGVAQAEWAPIRALADGMRRELDKVQAEERRVQRAAQPKLPRDPAADAAEMRYAQSGGPTDDLPSAETSQRLRAEQDASGQSRPPVSAAQVTARQPLPIAASASPSWLQTLQAKAYGGKDGE